MKDYYAILGVVPTAEAVVIKAAYKALAQRYHPDRNQGSTEAADKMVEINEAYAVLSDPERRKEYDTQRGSQKGDFNDWSHEEDQGESTKSDDPYKSDWAIAVKFCPDLEVINQKLSKTSHMLAFTYRSYILDTKLYDKRHELANSLEMEFLKSYFGSDPEIIEFAKQLIETGSKKAAKELNKAVRVMGDSLSAEKIINQICGDFGIENRKARELREEQEQRERREAELREQRERLESELRERRERREQQREACLSQSKQTRTRIRAVGFWLPFIFMFVAMVLDEKFVRDGMGFSFIIAVAAGALGFAAAEIVRWLMPSQWQLEREGLTREELARKEEREALERKYNPWIGFLLICIFIAYHAFR